MHFKVDIRRHAWSSVPARWSVRKDDGVVSLGVVVSDAGITDVIFTFKRVASGLEDIDGVMVFGPVPLKTGNNESIAIDGQKMEIASRYCAVGLANGIDGHETVGLAPKVLVPRRRAPPRRILPGHRHDVLGARRRAASREGKCNN